MSNFGKIPVGTVINYSGTFPDGLVALVNGWHGTATGNCAIGPIFAGTGAGHCLFDTGTGSLTAFHLAVAVTLDASNVWHWDGAYNYGP